MSTINYSLDNWREYRFTFKIPMSLVCAIVFSTGWVVPFHAEPCARCALDWPDITDGAKDGGERESLPRIMLRGSHDFALYVRKSIQSISGIVVVHETETHF